MESIWRTLAEDFDSNMPRMTAVYMKERDDNLSFVYPSGDAKVGYLFDFSNKSNYYIPPKFRIDFASYEYASKTDIKREGRTVFNRQIYYPGMLKRDLAFTSLGITATERFGQYKPGSLSWSFDITCIAEWYHFDVDLFTVLSSDDEFTIEQVKGALKVVFNDMSYYIAAPDISDFGVYQSIFSLKKDIGPQPLMPENQGHYLVIRHRFDIKPLEHMNFTIGLSGESAENAAAAMNAGDFEEAVEGRWNEWLTRLPTVALDDPEEKKAYYKSWVTIRNNYYTHPKWGYMVNEALPAYKGIWQWTIPSVEWYSDQDADHTSVWIKKAMDLLIGTQREDGYITHAIYVDEETPGERWASVEGGIVQTPHFPWAALRYYHATCDRDSIAKWYEPLCRYHEHLCRTRDEPMNRWHLWAIISSYDTGLDTTSAYQRVTFGEENIPREKYCYPAIFAAERYRYELSLGEMADILGFDGDLWRTEAELTRDAANRYLWDDQKKWFGLVHEDGSLDTRVGLDGLFALAYGMVSQAQARDMEQNVASLIGEYGVRTVARDAPGFRAETYWRGPSWPRSCATAMAACVKHYPRLARRVLRGTINMALNRVNIWECCNADTGALGHSDRGIFCTPGTSSNVGAADIICTLWLYHGVGMFDTDAPLPVAPMKNIHAEGMRISVSGDGIVTARAAEKTSARLKFRKDGLIFEVELTDGRTVSL